MKWLGWVALGVCLVAGAVRGEEPVEVDGLVRVALKESLVVCFAASEGALPEDVCDELWAWSVALQEGGFDVVARDVAETMVATMPMAGMEGRHGWYVERLRHLPESPTWANVLAWTLLEQTGDAEGALKLLGRQPLGGVLAWDTLAWAQYKAGRTVDAMHTILKTLELALEVGEAEEPIFFDHAGDILYANGHYREAYRCWAQGERVATWLIRNGHVSEEDLLGEDEYSVAHSRRKRSAVKKLHPEAFAQ